jgi:hypothetical protein
MYVCPYATSASIVCFSFVDTSTNMSGEKTLPANGGTYSVDDGVSKQTTLRSVESPTGRVATMAARKTGR